MRTRHVQKLLKIPSYWTLANLIRAGKVRPIKDEFGEYDWSEEDLETVRQALAAQAKRRGRAPRP